MEGKEQMKLREAWLEQAVILLREYMASCSVYLYSYPRASCGFPSRGGERRPVRTVGQCFSPKVCQDGRSQIFISPVVSGSIEILGILLHELIHAAAGVEHKHGKVFSQAAKSVGLVRPWRATTIGETLRPVFDRFVTLLVPIPTPLFNWKPRSEQPVEKQAMCPKKAWEADFACMNATAILL